MTLPLAQMNFIFGQVEKNETFSSVMHIPFQAGIGTRINNVRALLPRAMEEPSMMFIIM